MTSAGHLPAHLSVPSAFSLISTPDSILNRCRQIVRNLGLVDPAGFNASLVSDFAESTSDFLEKFMESPEPDQPLVPEPSIEGTTE